MITSIRVYLESPDGKRKIEYSHNDCGDIDLQQMVTSLEVKYEMRVTSIFIYY